MYWVIQHRGTGLYYVDVDGTGKPFNGNACNRKRYQTRAYAGWVAHALGKPYCVVRVTNAKAKIAELTTQLAVERAEKELCEYLAKIWEALSHRVAP